MIPWKDTGSDKDLKLNLYNNFCMPEPWTLISSGHLSNIFSWICNISNAFQTQWGQKTELVSQIYSLTPPISVDGKFIVLFAVSRALVILGFLLFLLYSILTGFVFKIYPESGHLSPHWSKPWSPLGPCPPLQTVLWTGATLLKLCLEPSSDSPCVAESKSQFYRLSLLSIPHLLSPLLYKHTFPSNLIYYSQPRSFTPAL